MTCKAIPTHDSDKQIDLLLRKHLTHQDAPHHFALGVMAKVRDQVPSVAKPLRLIKPDWVRWGSAVLASGLLLLLLTLAMPTATKPLDKPQSGTSAISIHKVQTNVENAFYNLADALLRPTMRLSEFLLGGIQVAP